MITNESDVFDSALALPPARRAALVHVLVDSLPEGDPAEIAEAWRVEIERRIAAYEAGEMTSVPAEEVFAKYRRGAP